MKTQLNGKIRIANPVPGEARYTSIERALKYVEQRVATMTVNNELFFHNNARVGRQQRDAVTAITESHIAYYRSGVVFWNGDGDPLERHRPGDVRS